MKKQILTFAALIGFATGPVLAEDLLACSDDVANQVMEQIDATTDDRKEAALEEFEMAKEKMAEGDVDACAAHLTNASKVATDS